MNKLAPVFTKCREQNRAALVGYLPAGYPTLTQSRTLVSELVKSGCDIVEVGVAFSDPVIDGPVIEKAARTAIANGMRVAQVFDVVEAVAQAGGAPVIMSYWNPILQYGVAAFSRDLANAGGLGMITPDLVYDEAEEWIAASDAADIDRIFLVAPSSSPQRLLESARASRGFVYATSVMGTTGARDQVDDGAQRLVQRVREVSDIPVGVGLGIRNQQQARQVAEFADAVIVGSALVSAANKSSAEMTRLTEQLAHGVRREVG